MNTLKQYLMKKLLNIVRGRAVVCAAILLIMPMIPAPLVSHLNSAPSAQGIREPDYPSDAFVGAGRREHFVRVDRWGRYSIEVKSPEGTALEVVDRLRGVFARAGEAGREDGRVDAFLEVGDYKIITESPRGAGDNFRVTVARYVPAGSAAESLPVKLSPDSLVDKIGGGRDDYSDYTYLKPFEQAATELGGMEARGWWIFVPRDTVVYIEAIGRRVGGFAVFRRGDWLVAAAEVNRDVDAGEDDGVSFVSASVPEKPLNGLRVIRRLERGKHLVVAYGGGKDRYATNDNTSPLYMQWMLDPIAPGRQVSAKIGGSGVNRYVVPSQTGLVIESLNREKLTVENHSIRSQTYGQEQYGQLSLRDRYSTHPNPGQSSRNNSAADRANPAVVANFGADRVLSVSGKPGSSFRIIPQNSTSSYTPQTSGMHQVTTFHTGNAADNIGASGILVDARESMIIAVQADTVSSSRRLYRKFNLLDEINSLVWIDEAGTYTFRPAGDVEFDWRVGQFFVVKPQNYSMPRKIRGKSDIALNRGLYVIELFPVNKGRAAFALSSKSADREISSADPAQVPRPSVTFQQNLTSGRSYRFYMNSQQPELSSVSIEKYPLSAQGNFAVITGEAAEREEAKTAEISDLAIGVPRYADVDKLGFRTYRFSIDKAGIYKVETTGRLHTRLTARDRFDGFRYTESGNGAGRNALVAGYFLPGSYLLVAGCEGESRGRMGVVVNRGEMRASGRLQEGIDRRASVPAYGAAYYDFTAAERGRYRVESFGLVGPMPIRFEDSRGWPLFEHGLDTSREVDIGRGAYKFYTLPIPYENYRVTRVEKIADKQRQVSGYGPHQIRINEPVSAQWVVSPPAREDSVAGGKSLPSVRFQFEVPASMEATITLSPDFQGSISEQQGKDNVPVPSARTINGIQKGFKLDRGKYEIGVSPIKEMNHAPYELSITTTDLLAGVGYDIDSAGMMRVRVGEEGVYEIFSQGAAEVSARLYAENRKTEITRSGGNDLQDWNFVISERLDSGTYYLSPTIDGEPGKVSTKIRMRRVEDTLMQAIKLSGSGVVDKKFSLAGRQIIIPIESASDDIMTVSVSGAAQVVCALEARPRASATAAKPARPIAVTGPRRGKKIDIATPVSKESIYTLKIWSEDKLGDEVRLQVKTVEAIPITYKNALNGVTGTAAADRDNTVFYKIDDMAGGPGHYELIVKQNEIRGVSGVSKAEKVFQREANALIESAGKQLWIEAAFASSDKYKFALNPVILTDNGEGSDRGKRKSAKDKVASPEKGELPVVMRPGQDKIFAIDSPMRKFGLVTFTMTSGQPFVGLSAPAKDADFVRNGKPVFGGQYVDDRICLTATVPGDTGRVVGWNALSGGSPDGIQGGFEMRHFTMEKADTLKTGRTVWQTAPSIAKEYIIETNRSRALNIKLSPDAGFLYAQPDGRRVMYYGGEGGAQHTLEPSGGRLFLFGMAEAGSIEIEAFASDAGGQKQAIGELSANAEIVRRFPIDTRETIRVKGEAKSNSRLFWSGAVKKVDWIDRSGRMTSGVKSESTLSGDGGVLLVKYAPGWGKLRICKDAGGGLPALYNCRWGEAVKTDNIPAIKEMSRLTMAGGTNWYSIEIAEPSHVSLSVPSPAAAVVSTGGKITDYGEFWDDLAWDLPLAPGKYTVGIKPLAARTLAGTPATVGFYPISPVTEDRPLDLYMMPGQKRMVRFDLEKRGKIGAGLALSGETVDAILLDNRGKRLSEGRQIFAELDKGTYYILLSMPASSALNGTDVKLYLFGQNNPPADPPEELVKWIIGGGVGDRPQQTKE